MAMNNTIKALREQNNYSQAAVAQFLGISRQMYIKYETGLVEPPVKIVSELAHFYHVTYDTIIDDSFGDKKGIYENSEEQTLEVHDSAPQYSSGKRTGNTLTYDIPPRKPQPQSMYLKSIIEMLPKLIYSEQLMVLEMIAEMVRNSTAEKIMPDKKMQSYEELLSYTKSLNIKSDGKKMTREEIYER